MNKENAEILKMFNQKINAIMAAESIIMVMLDNLTNYRYDAIVAEAHQKLVDSLLIKEEAE